MAQEMEARLGHQVFSHFPKEAVDALRRQSGAGSFPEVGGDLGVAISGLRGALVELADIGPQIAGQLSQMSTDVEAVRIAIQRHEIASEIAEVEFQSLASAQLSACAEALSNLGGANTLVNPGSVPAAAVRCFNSFYQVHLGEKLERLKQQDAGLATEAAIVDFHSRFSERAQLLERLDTRANAAIEEIDAQLAAIENLRLQARRSLHRAMYLNSLQAEKQMEINTVMRRRINTANIRYGKAFKNAQRLAFIAKLAIEQRLGMRLSDMHERLPLVEKPSSWESSVCANQGIDWSRIAAGDEEDEDPSDPTGANFADAYIGDYVRNLENVVESYRMVHAFHEGLDTAVISLKDDVYRSQSVCDVPSTNLLYHAGQLDQWKSPATTDLGWRLEGCATQRIDTDADSIPDTEQPLPDCVDVRKVDVTPTKNVEFGSRQMRGYRVTFGPEPPSGQQATCSECGLTAATRIVQSVDLGAGDYLLSWYHQPLNAQSTLNGAGSVTALLSDGLPALSVMQATTAQPNEWQRSAMTITVPRDQMVTIAIVPDPAVAPAPHEVLLGGFMLESARPSPSLFVDTDETRTRKERACNDPDGSVFRKAFNRGCVKLCANGFDGFCEAEDAVEHCYREVSLNLNQRDIESGRQLANTGFALGNYNYRIESIAANFVGTAIRDCSDADAPTSCNSRGYIPYSLMHAGPFLVRNHMGQDFKAELFTGHIEHARGLGAERYISNPISSADTELLAPYTRQEFQGRPLDGNFTFRVWDDEGVDFSKIEDIQVVLHYRYWTRFD